MLGFIAFPWLGPAAFSVDLATSISEMSNALEALDRQAEAEQASKQMQEILAQFVERFPKAYEAFRPTVQMLKLEVLSDQLKRSFDESVNRLRAAAGCESEE